MKARHFLLLGSIALSGCALIGQDESVSDVTLPFRASLDRGEDPREFTVSVAHRGGTVPMVRESVRFPATRYCLERFGGSDALWDMDPATDDWAFQHRGDTLVFSGRCVAR